MKNFSFIDKESYCQLLFDQNGPFWHIATPGNLTELLFTCPDDYRFGMTLTAICALETGLKVYAFQIMSNHIHEIVSAPSSEQCTDNLRLFAKRLKRYSTGRGRHIDLSEFICQPLAITSLQSLRNNIVYTHRNKYVIDSSQTPYSSPWGSGCLYFGQAVENLTHHKYNELAYREKRLLTNSRCLSLPDNYTIRNGCISPESFCDWKNGQAFFRDAHQYFNLLSKNYEAYAEFSALLGDSECVTDEEMFALACKLVKKEYNCDSPSKISNNAKKEIARNLHFNYHAGNNQIRRILAMDPKVLEEMFPMAK